jgi:hypothetical protein
MGVEAAFASVYHPQSNGVIEKANTLIFSATKKILEDQLKGKWAEEFAEGSMEPQHLHLQSDKIHTFQVVVLRRASNSRRN